MNQSLVWAVVGLAAMGLAVERRSQAVALVTAQALLLAVIGLTRHGAGSAEVVAALALAARAAGLAGLLVWTVGRTREERPVRSSVAPLARAGGGIGLALLLVAIAPPLGLETRGAERAALSVVAFGLVLALVRRATLHQLVGVVTVENGIGLAALAAPAGVSIAIELGAAIDLVLVAVVALVFHDRIFQTLGSGDAGSLRRLRD